MLATASHRDKITPWLGQLSPLAGLRTGSVWGSFPVQRSLGKVGNFACFWLWILTPKCSSIG